MAHIANCLANGELKPASPVPTSYSPSPTRSPSNLPFSTRMIPEQQQQRYQFFPKDKKLPPIIQGRPADNDQHLAAATKTDLPPLPNSIRARLNPHNLVRRRKISVPELGPMVTVQELAMDSPTIPGRPALHERSSSAPEDSKLSRAHPDQLYVDSIEALYQVVDDAFGVTNFGSNPSNSTRRLAPLVIPQSTAAPPMLQSKLSNGQLRTGTSPPMESLRSARFESSPLNPERYTPELPPKPTTDFISTPVSASVMECRGDFGHFWDLPLPPMSRSEDASRVASPYGHARAPSEPGNIMDRGRPRKRTEKSSNSPLWKCQDAGESVNVERKAFEELPKGTTAATAPEKHSRKDLAALKKQATCQAEKFEVLKLNDVEMLSKELRQLDDRTAYLRRTYMSLRSGRRNLHSRICQYLKSTSAQRFSQEAMLRQEEALGELDASIDEWFNKLEQAENRRMRVRQKLLEHVAAATTLLPDENTDGACCMHVSRPQDLNTPPRSPERHGNESPCSEPQTGRGSPESDNLQSRSGSETPPASAVVVPRVPSTILELCADEPNAIAIAKDAISPSTVRKSETESIRIYAGNDLLALLTDVENEITRLSRSADNKTPVLRSDSVIARYARGITKANAMLSGEAVSCANVPSLRTNGIKKDGDGVTSAHSTLPAHPEQITEEEEVTPEAEAQPQQAEDQGQTAETEDKEEEQQEEELIFLTDAVYKP